MAHLRWDPEKQARFHRRGRVPEGKYEIDDRTFTIKITPKGREVREIIVKGGRRRPGPLVHWRVWNWVHDSVANQLGIE